MPKSFQAVNKLLSALPESDYQRFLPHLEIVFLNTGQILYEPNEFIEDIYFPEQAIISVVSMLENGASTEVGLIGKEGMVGLPVFLGGNSSIYRAIVQVGGTVIKVKADLCQQEWARSGQLQKLLLLYTQARLTQVAQTAACNRHHTIEKRLARWLLLVRDGLEQERFVLTQEFIAYMLGVRRSGVTVAANILQNAGAIAYSRGRISILNQEILEASACECYRLVKQEFQRLLG